MSIRHAKARGEWAELRFMTRATELGFRVAKPWGDCAPYDVVTEHRGRFLRVQCKCTIFHRGNSYKCHLDSNGVPYSPRDLDIIAALVIPTDTWYILPIRATNGQPDILLTPQSPRAKYEKYKEAWHLLKH
ncbi:MAG TPA: group I intron-associated PD-(D/E)XK endonuclease [Candidatus Sulfotelmatobacter sp.]|nr:group I intron-associated PD-(D/E)XK endonuclease [Candidatus Sulfotelmatobacter sp.]